MTHPISRSGLPVTAGLKPMPNVKPSPWQRFTYVQNNDSLPERLANVVRLEKTENLQGMDKVRANIHNLVAIGNNPFATLEFWRHAIETGRMI